jgi:transcriptional regulator with XRE-family HTH domain
MHERWEVVAAPSGRRERPPSATPQAAGPQPPQPPPGTAGRLAGPPGGDARSEISLARQIRARGRVAGRRTGQIAAEIHDECGPVAGTTWIRARRLALGISLADVVAQVQAWYIGEGRAVPRFSETLLSAYESGQKRPGPEYLHYLCAVYQADPPDLGYPDPCFCGRGHREDRAAGPGGRALGARLASARAQNGHRPDTPAPGQADLQPGQPGEPGLTGWLDPPDAGPEDDDDVLRRTLLRLIADAGAAVDGQFFGAVDRIRRRMDDALVGGTVTAIMLDQWEEATVSYGKQYMTAPPLRLLCDVLLDFGDVRRMSERRQPLEFSERLCRLAGRLAGVAGMIMIDVGDQRLARSFFRTARTAADETGDRHLRAWVAVREALVPLYYGDPAEASALARAGAGLAGRNPCVAGVMAPVLEARSLARMAARRDDKNKQAVCRVQAMLSQAHDALTQLPAAERSDTAFGYTERQLLFHEGDTRVVLGDHRGAEKALTWSLELYAPDEILDRSLVALGLAQCRLAADEPEEALRLSRDTVLGVPRAHRSEIMVRMARSLGESVAGRHGEVRAVREYREALISA